jgi:uncharacterized protein involved in outer membrane biogenesis
MTLRRLAVYGVGLIALLAVLSTAALMALGQFDLAPVAGRYASHTLGRAITIGALRVRWGAAVTVQLHDLAIANASGGSDARMLRIVRLDAEITPLSLVAWAVLGHPPVVRHLTVDGARLLLEHAAEDRPNWRFGEPRPHRNPRLGFPTLLDARLHDAEIDLRASSGTTIRIRLDTASVASDGLDQPVTLSATGAYNDTPVTLSAALHSFTELHDALVPFGTDIHLTSADTTLAFAGTMTDPINADGAVGRLTLTAPNWDRLLAIAGAGGHAALPSVLAGTLIRHDDLWRLYDAKGTLVAHPFELDFNLREGARRQPDNISLEAKFAVLDLTALQDGGTSGATSMRIDDAPGNLLNAHIGAGQFAFGKVRANDVDLKLQVEPGALTVERLVFHLTGGNARISAAVKNTKSSAAIQFDADLIGADTGQFSRLFGIGSMPLSGAVDAYASLRLNGKTLEEAGATGSGGIVLSMQGGSIERNAVALASSDLRLLFGKAEGTARIACVLGVLDLQDGIGRLAPLRIRTADGTVAASGTIDLRRNAVDLTVASESGTTSLFALDVPLRVVGPIRGPHVAPAPGSGRSATQANADPRGMPAALQDVVRRSPCVAGGR